MGYEISLVIEKDKNGVYVTNYSMLVLDEEDVKEITPCEEHKKIWETFDFNAMKKACGKFKKDIDEFRIIIKSYDEFENKIKEIGLYEVYLEEKQSLDKRRELLNKENLTPVRFDEYTSWETGMAFMILKERVEKNIFSKLVKSGLYYHRVNRDCEENFNGWCIDYSEDNILKLAENGIKIR